jgi:glycosyltransferase involved in cell wall biosynthesis
VRVLIQGLRLAGHEIIEVNEPLGLSTAERVSMLQKPWTAPVLPARLLGRWIKLWRRGRALRNAGPPDAVLVGYLGHFDVHLARRVFPGTTIALDHLIFAAGTAVDRGARKGLLTRALDLVDRRALSAADVIVLDTAEHQAAVPADLAARTVVAPVGADAGWFAAGEHAIGGPAESEAVKVVFYGLYTPLQGAVVIGRAMRRLAELGVGAAQLSVTMIGTGQDLEATKEAAGPDAPVQWIDWVPAADLPAVVAAHHVALGIFGTTAKGANVVPNKVYQAAAAGCAIVTSDTPPQRRMLGEAAEFVPAGDPEALALVLARLVRDRDLLALRRRQTRELAIGSFAASVIVGALMDRLNSVPTNSASPVKAPVAPLTPRAALRWPLIKKAMRQAHPATALEIGCGQGAMGSRLVSLTTSFLAVEPDAESASTAASRIEPRGGQVINGFSSVLDPGRTFDIVCAFEVLEHIEDDAAALVQWRDQIAPGGYLLLSVPAWQHLFSPSDTAVGHYRRYSPTELTTRLREAGFEPQWVTLYGWPLGYILESVRSRLARTSGKFGESTEDQTAGSGRWLQPSGRVMSYVISVGVAPFQVLQWLFSNRGNGIVALARRR